ncbi:MAG TPA: hypothetical protein ENJ41_03800 [Oceanospirillales bacterium]|nr:hypothetical protein [Oceanospirillales bacterium]
MKKLLLVFLVMASVSLASAANPGFELAKADVAQASLLKSKGDSQINGWCEVQCRIEFNNCLAQPDPYNINLDICRERLNMCLQTRCGWGVPINF